MNSNLKLGYMKNKSFIYNNKNKTDINCDKKNRYVLDKSIIHHFLYNYCQFKKKKYIHVKQFFNKKRKLNKIINVNNNNKNIKNSNGQENINNNTKIKKSTHVNNFNNSNNNKITTKKVENMNINSIFNIEKMKHAHKKLLKKK